MRQLKTTTRPGTGVSSKGSERIVEILEAARDVLIERGYHGFTMRAVARGCGITVGNLNYYYASKTDLLRDLLENVIESYLAEFQRIRAAAPPSPRAELEAIIRFIMDDLATKETTVFFPELWALANHDAHAAERMEALYRKARLVYDELIPKINPTLSATDARRVALFLSAAVEGHTMFLGHRKPWARHRKAVQNIAVKALVDLVEGIAPEDIAGPSSRPRE